MFSRPVVASAFALSFSLLALHASPAAAEEGEVSGVVELPPLAKRKSPPILGQGFVPRAKNPLRPPDGYDPRSEIVIVLQDGPVAEDAKRGRTERYKIVGENFEHDVLAVVKGGKVEIKNEAQKSIRLYSQSSPDLLPPDPINHKGGRLTKAIDKTETAIDIRDQDSVHFLAHVVAFDHGYFALPDHEGKFDIADVPAGTWTVKVWYRNAWVVNLPKTTITVGKRGAKGVKVTLPAKLKTAE